MACLHGSPAVLILLLSSCGVINITFIAERHVVFFAEQHGGVLVGESEAMYLFSDDAFTKDTTRY